MPRHHRPELILTTPRLCPRCGTVTWLPDRVPCTMPLPAPPSDRLIPGAGEAPRA